MNIYDFTVLDTKKNEVKLDEYKGKVLLVVNTATGCGFTPQYEALENLYKKYQFSKIEVNGEKASPLFTYLKENGPEEKYEGFKAKATATMLKGISKTFKKANDIRWNFTKFLVDREGNVVGRYAPTTKPEDIEKDVLKYL